MTLQCPTPDDPVEYAASGCGLALTLERRIKGVQTRWGQPAPSDEGMHATGRTGTYAVEVVYSQCVMLYFLRIEFASTSCVFCNLVIMRRISVISGHHSR